MAGGIIPHWRRLAQVERQRCDLLAVISALSAVISVKKGKPEAPAFLDSHFRGNDGLMVGRTVSNGITYSAAPKMATEQVKEPGRPPRLWVKPKPAFCNWRAAALPCNCL